MNDIARTLLRFLVMALAGAGGIYLICTLLPRLLYLISSSKTGKFIIIAFLAAIVFVLFWVTQSDSGLYVKIGK